MANILSALGSIVGIIGKVNTIRELFGGNAAQVITIADLERVVRGENARFFTTIAFANIETIHNRFYRNWLPTIANRPTITANDINLSTGPLYHVFRELLQRRNQLADLMNVVREVFRTYAASLHVDELVGGVLAFMHGFGLLLHIHGVYAELRRIQIGAASLDDRDLLTDTLAALQYTVDAETVLNLFLRNSTIENRRLDEIGPVRLISIAPATPIWFYFDDRYRARSSTPSDVSLEVYRRDQDWASSAHAQNMREQYVQNVRNRTRVVIVNPANGMLRDFAALTRVLRARERIQSGPCAVIWPSITEAVENIAFDELNLGVSRNALNIEAVRDGTEVDFRWGDIHVPENAEAFIALSKRLRARARNVGENFSRKDATRSRL